MAKASIEYYSRYGRAMAEWADIEYMLSLWFAYLSGMTPHMADEIFGSARSFNASRDMLNAAFYARRRDADLTAFYEETMKRVMSYYSFRNFLAHHQTVYVGPERRLVLKKRTDKFLRGMVISTKDLGQAVANFNRLSRILLLSVPNLEPEPRLTPKQGLAQILQLPPDARSKGIGRSALQKHSLPPRPPDRP